MAWSVVGWGFPPFNLQACALVHLEHPPPHSDCHAADEPRRPSNVEGGRVVQDHGVLGQLEHLRILEGGAIIPLHNNMFRFENIIDPSLFDLLWVVVVCVACLASGLCFGVSIWTI
jgi:hypothetical protein